MDDMEDDVGLGRNKMPKVAKVKNKMPAPVQITAEQLLREAKERELELVQPPPKQKISDEAELKDYQMRKRKAFEDNIRKNRSVITNWLKYASWEESQHALRNARSVYERALDVDHRNITIWLKYAEMEMRNKQINSARNVWDRAVTILPRANQFWYKYTYMEELLGNMAGCRQVFERWMEWEPEEQAWHSYINFELRYKELNRARIVYERFVIVHPHVKNWIKYAKFEEKNGFISSARRIYERAVEYFGDEHISEQLLTAFARFEEGQKEHERARVIFKYALDRLPKDQCQEIYRLYTIHEKKFGDRAAIEDVIISKRRFHYEEEVKSNPFNYDAWFDYLRLLESDGQQDAVRELYERAIANVPPSKEKRHWRRYIYLWINYALYEELETGDMEQTRQVYKACLDLLPHSRFTFAKIWIYFAKFEIRQKNLMTARKIMGAAIGKCPKDKLFRSYIELELQLREFERCRILYEKFLEFSPENCTTWMKFAELETILNDIDRARAIYELAITQPLLDMPEVLWKSFIDFEVKLEEYDNVRGLYHRLLQRTQHVKVWISYAQFELSVGSDNSIEKCREVYRKANRSMKSCEEKEERVMLLESWRDFEYNHGDENSLAAVEKLQPNKVKRTRKVEAEGGVDGHWEEYFDYIFPDDEGAKPNLRLLAIAKSWKKDVETKRDDDTEIEPAAIEEPSGEDEGNKNVVEAPSVEERESSPKQDDDRDDDSTSSESEAEDTKKSTSDEEETPKAKKSSSSSESESEKKKQSSSESDSDSSPEPVKKDSDSSPEPVKKDSDSSSEPVKKDSDSSPEPVKKDSDSSPERVKKDSDSSPEPVKKVSLSNKSSSSDSDDSSGSDDRKHSSSSKKSEERVSRKPHHSTRHDEHHSKVSKDEDHLDRRRHHSPSDRRRRHSPSDRQRRHSPSDRRKRHSPSDRRRRHSPSPSDRRRRHSPSDSSDSSDDDRKTHQYKRKRDK